MAYSVLAYLALFSLVADLCHSFNRKLVNEQQYGSAGMPTTQATWYGGPNSDGSNGGACGFEADVGTAPFSSLITAVGPSLYDSGHGCGTCYQVKCTSPAEHCSGNVVVVVATDLCGGCVDDHFFDLSGTAYGAMAKPGHGDQLRNVGITEIEYQMVECNFGATKVSFKTDTGSNPSYFATEVEYEDGFELTKVEMSNDSTTWIQMSLSWGSRYMVNLPGGKMPPYSIKLTANVAGKGTQSIVAENVIPFNYTLGKTYPSTVNFAV